jgi:membrane associated rhomboid family serine protease
VTQPPPQPPLGRAVDAVPVCYRHPDRETYIRCSRCERPICPDCMIPAAVGFQCPECVRAGRRDVRPARTLFGGRVADNPGYLSKAILAVTVAVFLLQQGLGAAFTGRFYLLGLFPPFQLAEDSLGVAAGEWYRLATAAFLHGSVLHLAFNMYALYLFGPPLEAALGRVRFLALYLLAALGGSAASYAFSAPTQASLGASGAIFGLFAGYLVMSRKLGRDTSALVVLLAVNVVLGFTFPSIDWRAHAGGFLAGGVLAYVMVHAPRERRTVVHLAGSLALALAVLVVVAARTAQLTGTGAGEVLGCAVTAPASPAQTFPGCLTAGGGALATPPGAGVAGVGSTA